MIVTIAALEIAGLIEWFLGFRSINPILFFIGYSFAISALFLVLIGMYSLAKAYASNGPFFGWGLCMVFYSLALLGAINHLFERRFIEIAVIGIPVVLSIIWYFMYFIVDQEAEKNGDKDF